MSVYEALAASYDRFTNDVPYQEVADYLELLFRTHGARVQTVLDLACGTGSLAGILAERGYQVTGTDRSVDMLTVAFAKTAEMKNRPFFVHQSMQKLKLPTQVDAAVCTLDSLNYLTQPEDCRKTICRVYDALVPGGVFIFDVNTPEKLRALDGQVFLDEDEDQYCVWRASFEDNICYYGMDLFQRRGKLWQRSFEEHAEYAYSLEELEQYLRSAGFGEIHIYADRTLTAPREGEQRVYFFARKEKQSNE
ncbi:MAG: class I SAM-dependent methyltransferase [Oscillospiraceae bacterium]|nr:class I SAM-dependent methyltransferase [Oscillospiraceae bacterium]